MDGLMKRRISLNKEVELPLPLDPILDAAGKRINPETVMTKCFAEFDGDITGCLLDDKFEILVREVKGKFDVVPMGPQRGGFAVVKVYKMALTPLQPPPQHVVKPLPGIPQGKLSVDRKLPPTTMPSP